MLSKLCGCGLWRVGCAVELMSQAWRDVKRLLIVQVWIALIGLLLFGLGVRWISGLAFAVGVVLITSGTLLSARFGLRRATEPAIAMAFVISSLAWKWLWIVAGLFIAIKRLNLPPIWLVAGVIAAQLANIVQGIVARRF
jgi:hypothetical protein